MRKPFFFVISIIIIFVVLIGLVIFYQRQRLEVRQRENLAIELGLDPGTYSRDPYFPENYFYEVLLLGMPINKVHQTIKGYEAVYTCENSFEIYYFYSTSIENATRIAIFYDQTNGQQKRLINVMTEDKDSLTLPSGDCIPGALKPDE